MSMANTYCFETGKHIMMSEKDSAIYHNKHYGDIGGCGFSYPVDIFNRDKKEILEAMKSVGYEYEFHDVNGKPFAFQGAISFKKAK